MPNDEMRQHWTDNASGWVRHERIFDGVFAPLTTTLLETSELGPGLRVLDVGCGSGTLLAAAIAAGGDAVGVDVSPGMVEAARQRVPGATVLLADAQTTDLRTAAPGLPFDRVVSRFGVMFFEDPVAAFTGIRAAAAPDARLTFACWRDLDENLMMTLGQDVLTARLEPDPEASAPGDGPGPQSFADPDRVHTVLDRAGWADVAVKAHDFTCDYGFDGSDGVENRLASLFSITTGRRARELLEPRLGPAGWAALLEETRAHLRDHLVDGSLQFPGAVWIVTARA